MTGSITTFDTDHEAEQSERRMRALWKAHTSPVFHRIVLRETGIDLREAERSEADNQSEGSTPSVHTCEQPSTTQQIAIGEAEQKPVSPATEAIRAALGRDRDTQRTVIELIKAGEASHAKRLANCQRQSVQLGCPEMAGGCGCDENFVPISCDSRLCETCGKRRMGQAIEQYTSHVEKMRSPTLATFTIPNTPDAKTGKEAVQGAFGRLRQRGIPYEGEFRGESWRWGTDGGTPMKYQWRRALRAGRRHDLARSLQKRFVDRPRRSVIPWDELVRGGLYGIDIKQQEKGRFHVHLHAIIDAAYIPQPALASVWHDLTGAHVVDVRRVGSGQYAEKTVSEAVAEVVGYVAKPPDFVDEESEVEYMLALKGARLIQPFGHMHGVQTRQNGLLECAGCGGSPRFWDYLGVVDEAYDTMGKNWDTGGENDPPEESA